MAVDHGTDISCLQDIDARFALASGRTNLAYAVVRRLETPLGNLPYDKSYGFNVRALIGAVSSEEQRAAARAGIEGQCLLEERILSASAELNLIAATSTLEIAITLEDADGPFRLVLAVTDLTVELLRIEE
jgi:hypothetical protein